MVARWWQEPCSANRKSVEEKLKTISAVRSPEFLRFLPRRCTSRHQRLNAALITAIGLVITAAPSARATPIPIPGDACTGVCGMDSANGDVTNPPGFSSYFFVTTARAPSGGGTLPAVFGSPGATSTNGSTSTTPSFSATAGELIDFEFNYVTSDGSSNFPDYAWAALMSTDGGSNYLIFSAQTQPTGNTVPGFTMPPLASGASLIPPTAPITAGSGTTCGTLQCNNPPGGPVWSELGGDSGLCFARGCGLTGWIESNFTGEAADNYVLEFGVSNANDTAYGSGLAFAGAEVGGVPIIATVPEPSSFVLLCTGIWAAGLAVLSRRRKAWIR